MTAVLYLRVGHKRDDHDQTLEPESQSVRLREFAAALGWTIVAEFTDHESGANQFQAMMAAASRQDFDVVLVWSLDTFSEGIYKTLQHLNTLGGYGVGFRSFREPFIDTTSESGDLLRSIFAFFAAFEREQLSARVRAGHDRVRAQGKRFGRPKSRPDTKLLGKIRGLREDGHSMRQIAKILDIDPDKVKRLASDRELREKTRTVLNATIAQVNRQKAGL